MMLRKKFFRDVSLTVPVTPDGAYAIFKTTGNGSSKYTYTADTSAVATVFPGTGDRLISVGNSLAGIFYGASAAAQVQKYTYAANTCVQIATLSMATIGSGSASASTAAVGIVAPFSSTTVIPALLKYTFASDTNVATTSAQNLIISACGAGNADTAIFACGGAAAAGTNITNLYSYADETVIAGPTLTTTSKNGGAAGNTVNAFFIVGGSAANTGTNVYNYANNTTVGGSAASPATLTFQSTGNSVKGVFSNRGAAATLKCAYASGVYAAGGNLSAITVGTSNGATSNGNSGIL